MDPDKRLTLVIVVLVTLTMIGLCVHTYMYVAAREGWLLP